MGTLGRFSHCVLYLDSCTSCLDYKAAKCGEYLPEWSWCFVGWGLINEHPSLRDFLLIFSTFSLALSCSVWYCLFQGSTCVSMIKGAVSEEARSLLLWRSETRLKHREEITCKSLGAVKLLLLKRAVWFCQSWNLWFFMHLKRGSASYQYFILPRNGM